jgi:hypothetical protein
MGQVERAEEVSPRKQPSGARAPVPYGSPKKSYWRHITPTAETAGVPADLCRP